MNAAHVARLERCLLIVARVVERDPAALPHFERVDNELRAAKAQVDARRMADPVARARALAMARKAS